MNSESVRPTDDLQRLITVLDPELSSLPANELLDQLLPTVERLLDVDTVTVLLLDRSGTWLVATASRGLEEEVHQGTRIPFGRGFAGRIASTRAPVVLASTEMGMVLNPLLVRKGVRSMLGVPLVAGGSLLGVMHVGSLTPRRFTDDDTATLQQAAELVALALDVRLRKEERSAARILQRSLLPANLPQVDGLAFASRFVAAEEFGIGGDWFDTFVLPGGRTGIVIGDVVGSGLNAAVVMGRLRSALRAYAIESDSPAEALQRLDRKFAHFEPSEMATVLYAIVAADLSAITLCSKGHPPPVVAQPSEPTVIADCPPAPPIGANVHGEHADVTLELASGTTVGFYTDGLVERRGESIDCGLERLRSAFYAGDPEEVCTTVMAELIGLETATDDTALLVVRRV